MQAYNGKFGLGFKQAPVKWLYDQLGGQTTTFAWVAFGIGAALAFAGKLEGNYIALVGAIGGLVTARAIAEDKLVRGPQMARKEE